MNWIPEDKENVVNSAINIATTVDSLRQVFLLAITDKGEITWTSERKDTATYLELIAALHYAASDMELSLKEHTTKPDSFLGGIND